MIYEANQRSSACDFRLIRFRRDLYVPPNLLSQVQGSLCEPVSPLPYFPSISRACPRKSSIQTSIVNGFCQMSFIDRLAAFEIGDGPPHFQDAIIGPGGKAEGFHGGAEQRLGQRRWSTITAQVTRGHVCIAMNSCGILEPFPLNLPCHHYP